MNAAREWRLHLRSAYHDRLIYWWCRYASRHSMDVLTIIIDSMDKAKFAWPQYPWGRTDKTLHSFRRPRLVVTGAFAHGYGTFLFIADDNLSHGSCAFCDVLCRVLESVWAQCKRRGLRFRNTWSCSLTTPRPKQRTPTLRCSLHIWYPGISLQPLTCSS